MTRISVEEARRLGILAGPDGRVAKRAQPRAGGAKARTVAAGARPARKATRHPDVATSSPFDVYFFAPGEPVTKGRARTHLPKAAILAAFDRASGDAAAFAGHVKGVKHASYTPAETVRFERALGRCAAAAMRSRQPAELPVDVWIAAVFEGTSGTWPTASSDPDVDNVQKAVLDSMKGIVWTDDRLVVRATAVKACGPSPGVHVWVRAAQAVDLTALSGVGSRSGPPRLP